ncbi:hypothetical protein DdX_17518 [Ditylenchus destructor]|uniref:Uncharacterized protein n=1 Tax=Ditylenchus destructor TaxID=166010 RepID=A0AAD4MR90_9BILA|nr:hypothetical protein DdX_17518 [Ditylenchus destructor]
MRWNSCCCSLAVGRAEAGGEGIDRRKTTKATRIGGLVGGRIAEGNGQRKWRQRASTAALKLGRALRQKWEQGAIWKSKFGKSFGREPFFDGIR